ncbi:MAG: hypothetical protein ACRENJ_10315, partial [Candidatus Eiseniibacteriota bacterium]
MPVAYGPGRDRCVRQAERLRYSLSVRSRFPWMCRTVALLGCAIALGSGASAGPAPRATVA